MNALRKPNYDDVDNRGVCLRRRPSHPDAVLNRQLNETIAALSIAASGARTASELCAAAVLIREMAMPRLTLAQRTALIDALLRAEAMAPDHLPAALAGDVREGIVALSGLVLAADWPNKTNDAEALQYNEWRGLALVFRNSMESQAIREDLAERRAEHSRLVAKEDRHHSL